MTNLFANTALTIAPGQTASGVTRQARTLHVGHGSAWITIEGCRQDFVLAAGQSLAIAPGRLVVAEAGTDGSSLAISATPLPPARPQLWLAAARRLLHQHAGRLQPKAGGNCQQTC